MVFPTVADRARVPWCAHLKTSGFWYFGQMKRGRGVIENKDSTDG